jgi:hypothetical protein
MTKKLESLQGFYFAAVFSFTISFQPENIQIVNGF